MTEHIYTNSYLEYKRYYHDIFLDVMHELTHNDLIVVKETFLKLGHNEIHYLVSYHQKAFLNSLYFNDEVFIYFHQNWLYRVYYHRNINLEFFEVLNNIFLKICNIYISSVANVNIASIYNKLLQDSKIMQEEALSSYALNDDPKIVAFTQLLIEGNKQAVMEHLAQFTTLEQFLKFYSTTVTQAMKNVGILWEKNDISVAKEHLSTNIIESVVFEVLEQFIVENTIEKHIFLCSAPNEMHGLGNKIASVVLEKKGYKVTNLGGNLPSDEILKAIELFEPDVVVLSATLQTSLIDIALIIEQLKNDDILISKNMSVAIAGGAFESISDPVGLFEVDYYINNLQEMLEILEEL